MASTAGISTDTLRYYERSRVLTALAALKSDLQGLLSEWDARLADTPAGQQAKLLESLPVAGRQPARKSDAVP